jgi:hypothetical protein
VVERLISFAAFDGAAYGALAIADDRGAGVVGDGRGELAIEEGDVERGDGALRLHGADAGLICGVASQSSPLGFETGGGPAVSVQAIGVSAELESSDIDGFDAAGVAWSVEGSDQVGTLRTLWSGLADGSLLVLFSLRPPDVDDHGAEAVGAARIGRNGGVTAYAEPLLSTEYGGGGEHVRATLELWGEGEDPGLPARGAGEREHGGDARLGAGTLRAARFLWRLDGTPGIGGYEIVAP